MTDPGGRAGLENETLSPFRIGGQFRGQQLQCDRALEPEILRAIDHTHSALTNHTVNAVLFQVLPDQRV